MGDEGVQVLGQNLIKYIKIDIFWYYHAHLAHSINITNATSLLGPGPHVIM